MIIKKWNGSSWDEQFPKTITDQIYTGDGVTQIFDTGTDKIKEAYLPDSAFGDMRFVQGFDPNSVDTDTLLELETLANAFVTANGGTLRGCYFVATDDGPLTEGVGVNEFGDDAQSINAGDWVIVREEGTPNIWDVVNNTYAIASSTAPGLVQVGYAENAQNYPVELASNKMYVNVPWANTTYSKATVSALGLVKVEDSTVQTEAANAVSSTASRTYGVQFNSSDQLVVNVPWTDNNTEYAAATISNLGLIKLTDNTPQTEAPQSVTSTAGRTYGIQLNASSQAMVNVPWTDTTYSIASSTVAGVAKLGSDTEQTVAANGVTSTASRTYAVQLNSNDQMVVNVPWSDSTVGSASSTVAGTLKIEDDTTQTTAANTVTSTASRTYGIQLNASGQAVVNVPWVNDNNTYDADEVTLTETGGDTFAMKYPIFHGDTLPTSDIATNAIGFEW